MAEDKRRARRSPMKVHISIGKIEKSSEQMRYIDVEVLNISETGVGFITPEQLEMDAYYDSVVRIENGDRINSVLRIVRSRECEGGFEYGAQLLGLSHADTLKIGIFQMVND